MDTNSGTIYQFQSNEEKERHEKMLREAFIPQLAKQKFTEMVGLKNLPKQDCEFCAGAGAVQSKITFKWIPCRCTNPA